MILFSSNTSKSGDEQISMKETWDCSKEMQNNIHHNIAFSTLVCARLWLRADT